MKTIEQERGEILAKKLSILNDFLISQKESGQKFGQFLSKKGKGEKDFFAGLPDSLVRKGISTATADSQQLFDYTQFLNDQYVNQYLKYEEKKMDDGEDNACDGCPKKQYSNCTGCDDVSPEEVDMEISRAVVPVDEVRYYDAKGGKKRRAKKDKLATEHGCQPGYKWSKLRKKCVKDGKFLNNANKLNPAFVLMRSSFRSILALNLFGIASALKMLSQKDSAKWNKFLTKWFKLGGNRTKLQKSIDKGSKKKMFPKLKAKRNADGMGEYFWEAGGGDEESSVNVPAGDTESPPKDVGKLAAIASSGLAGAAGILAATPGGQPVAVWVGSAAPVIAAAIPILKSFAKEKGVPDSELPPDPEQPNEDLKDDDEDEKGKPTPDVAGFFNKYKWYIAGGAGLAGLLIAVFAIKKK